MDRMAEFHRNLWYDFARRTESPPGCPSGAAEFIALGSMYAKTFTYHFMRKIISTRYSKETNEIYCKALVV